MLGQEIGHDDIKSFSSFWPGGYLEGDPLDPMGRSGYGDIGYMSVLHATYLACIRPYINNTSTVLELGPGRGGWTKCFLETSNVWCVDVIPEELNGFYNYLGRPNNVRYVQASDFSCSYLPDDTFDYLFSFGCFCHISPQNIWEYFRNLYPKMKRGAHAFIQYADYDKYNKVVNDYSHFSIERIFERRLYTPFRLIYKLIKLLRGDHLKHLNKEVDSELKWYHLGKIEAGSILESLGYKVIDLDVCVNHRDPVVHFVKP
jgi:SAM-dependent methyltransferase